jgi:hypothetical protein
MSPGTADRWLNEKIATAVKEAYAEGYETGFTQRGIGNGIWDLDEDWELSESKKLLEDNS